MYVVRIYNNSVYIGVYYTARWIGGSVEVMDVRRSFCPKFLNFMASYFSLFSLLGENDGMWGWKCLPSYFWLYLSNNLWADLICPAESFLFTVVVFFCLVFFCHSDEKEHSHSIASQPCAGRNPTTWITSRTKTEKTETIWMASAHGWSRLLFSPGDVKWFCKSVPVIDVEWINLHGGWTVKPPAALLICRVSLVFTPRPWACYYIFLLSGNGFISLVLSPTPSLPSLQIVFCPLLRCRHILLSPSGRRWSCWWW